MKTLIELRQGIGGDHSKIIVEDMANLYTKVCRINNFSVDVIQ